MAQPLYSNAGFVQPLEIRKYSDFTIQLVLKEGEIDGDPFNLTDCTILARLSQTANAIGPWDFECSIIGPPTDGIAECVLPRLINGSIPASPASLMASTGYTWACDIILSDSTIVPYCHGPVRIVDSPYSATS